MAQVFATSTDLLARSVDRPGRSVPAAESALPKRRSPRCKAGKHVFVEKPMALTAADCDKMVKAAEKAGKQLLVGHVLPLLPEYAFARKAIARAASMASCSADTSSG